MYYVLDLNNIYNIHCVSKSNLCNLTYSPGESIVSKLRPATTSHLVRG